MLEDSLISIVIPVYNVEQYLKKCLDSVLNQTYKKIEIILVDDGSTDKSSKICDSYAKKDIRVKVIHQENSGVSSARNVGTISAKGEYICFLDSDDWIEKNYIRHMYKSIKDNKCDIVVTNYNIVTEKIEKGIKKPIKKSLDNVNHVVRINEYGGYCWNKLYKRNIINNIQFNIDIKIMEDLIFNLDVWKKNPKVYYLNEELYNYRIRDNSALRIKRIPDDFEALKTIYSKLETLNSKYENDFKLRYVYDYYINKAINKEFDSEKIIEIEINKIYNFTLFIRHGALSIKIKILITKLFPGAYLKYKKN